MSSIVLKHAYKAADGKTYPAGETISVPFGEGKRLIALGVGRYLTDAPPPDDAAKTSVANKEPELPPGLTPPPPPNEFDRPPESTAAGKKK